MIEINNLQKKFEEKILFDDYNLKIEDGEFVVLSGESGSGKTTLLNMIGGLELINKGTIFVNGIDITKRKNEGENGRSKEKKARVFYEKCADINGSTSSN